MAKVIWGIKDETNLRRRPCEKSWCRTVWPEGCDGFSGFIFELFHLEMHEEMGPTVPLEPHLSTMASGSYE